MYNVNSKYSKIECCLTFWYLRYSLVLRIAVVLQRLYKRTCSQKSLIFSEILQKCLV